MDIMGVQWRDRSDPAGQGRKQDQRDLSNKVKSEDDLERYVGFQWVKMKGVPTGVNRLRHRGEKAKGIFREQRVFQFCWRSNVCASRREVGPYSEHLQTDEVDFHLRNGEHQGFLNWRRTQSKL